MSECGLRVDEALTVSKILVGKGIRQRDTVSPKLFTLVLEDVLKSLERNRSLKQTIVGL